MVEVFNQLNVKVSCLGNHDLDFGVERMIELTGKTKPCKWLISNLFLAALAALIDGRFNANISLGHLSFFALDPTSDSSCASSFPSGVEMLNSSDLASNFEIKSLTAVGLLSSSDELPAAEDSLWIFAISRLPHLIYFRSVPTYRRSTSGDSNRALTRYCRVHYQPCRWTPS